ncbi:MAG: hypothetical protein ACRC62_38365 [Microcoleus sp.]
MFLVLANSGGGLTMLYVAIALATLAAASLAILAWISIELTKDPYE